MEVNFENLNKIDIILEELKKLEEKVSSDKRWLNTKEAAYYLGYSQEHMPKLKDNHFVQGKHYHKTAGRILFDKVELDNWVTTTHSIDVNNIINHLVQNLEKEE